MNIKQKIAQILLQTLNKVMGDDQALELMKYWLRRLPTKYAFPITWVCLNEFTLDSTSESKWESGVLRDFPNVQVNVNPKCLGSRFFSLCGYFEDDLTQKILNSNYSGLLVDIGANFGYYSILWLQKNNSRVIAVEPVTEYIELLEQNLSPYESRYKIFKGCVGDYQGKALLDTCGDPTMVSRVVPDDGSGKMREVPMIALTPLLEKYNEDRIEVLKVDAEGYDVKILNNCKPLFEAKKIKTVFWESAAGSEYLGNVEAEKEIILFLERLGYRRIMSGGIVGYELPAA
ncbi:FkbM family methyltransferase [Roseofilum sp. BLCC_M91]|uniref:FkbM family methyltransferase n=1 Tax=Roseofilum halophilum BLCC-M91 TaxID=3022259 RepID=A0ABT7BME6_9CYAN|nr:FkbM family methyltransferase [Roseofilum halophilum]MDJ1179453.1 FkbM family methyltransferase [Roseofilum halophilum BLCC-M91]